ncbi:SDR family NAD(P)-dependent oxidoreductase [Nocardioides anomalus]|uniref:SDR family NAD(P)-dependent oxidoreductase n=1 Tax=Nocardioides anomalus TaxID=2712223 RepID=A0A6G6WDT8_9ACTN|nr:oxidoreductase [Nocardioides anomalus]QIG43265.1 SDR family NAD(P)-dependent oxidoreductase [Nocardioides anomalus]
MSTRPWREVPRQDGRRFVVTGASGGIGLETAKALAARGAHVVLAVRSLERGRAAAARMSGEVSVGLLDVADLASVRAFAETVDAVDVLVNNAGVLALPYGTSPDGVELHLATNHLGHFALTNLLLPRLTDRVVVVGSPSHRHGELDVGDLGWRRRRYRPYAAYADSKLANLLFLAELQRRLTAAGSTLRATGAHPGSTATGITGHTGNRVKTAVGSFGHRLVGMAPWQGALPTLYAATMDVPGNTYVGPHRLREMTGWPTGAGRSQRALDPELGRALWAESERLSGVAFPL